MRLYIVRHAQSTNNASNNPSDRDFDPPLTELGHRQAELVAKHLATGAELQPVSVAGDERGYGITRLYCSPMWRSLQTARPIGQSLGLTTEIMIEIHEQGGIFLDYGEEGGIVGYPGATRQAILSEFPNYLLPETITDEGWWSGGCEDQAGCYDRASRVASQLRDWAETEERIVLVSHGAFIDALLKTLFYDTHSDRFYFSHYNTGITRLDFRDGQILTRYSNRISHLPRELITW